MTDKEKEIQQNLIDNVAGDIMDDAFIISFSNPILGKPKYVSTKPGEETKLYSTEQMVDMFRAGFLSMSHQTFDKRVFEKTKSRSQSPFHIMKQMQVGSVRIFPYAKWNATRCAASTLKRQFGSVFVVQKTSQYKEIGDIKVKRVK